MISFDFDRFIDFGNALKIEQRRSLVKYWKFKTGRMTEGPIKASDLKGLSKYIAIIDDIISSNKILDLLKQNDEIFNDVSQQIFNSIENTHKMINLEGPYKDEEVELINWQNKTGTSFFSEFDIFLENISKYYKKKQIDSSFFQQEYDKIKNAEYKTKKDKQNKNHKLKALRKELLERWEKFLERRKHLYFLKELDKAREELCKKLYEQMEQLEKLFKILKPFTNELGRLWDLSEGMWKTVDFNILEKYAELLEKEPELQKIAEYLGRMHQEEDELEEQKIREIEILVKTKIQHAGKSELVGVHESADINNLLPLEVCLLTDPDMELIFYKKFAENKLLTYQFVSREKYSELIDKEITQLIPKKNKRGPIIICIDTSGSMHGTPEHVAKVLCFAILKIALMQNRSCYLISFSRKIKTLELTDLKNSLVLLIEFLTHSFHGGTDATPALKEAIDKTKHSDFIKADILMISDFIMNKVSEDVMIGINNSKNNGTRFHSLVISSTGNPSVLEIFDNNWIYNPDDEKPFKNVLKNIRYLNTRNELDS